METSEAGSGDTHWATSQDTGDSPGDAEASGAEWVDVTLDKQLWDQLARRLEDLVALSCLVHAKPSKVNVIYILMEKKYTGQYFQS